MWKKDIQHIIKAENTNYKYNNIPIYCAAGVHEKVFEYINNNITKKDSSILILGAGAGAFDERLFDAGFTNITSTEIRPEIYNSRANLISIDLDKDFSYLGKYDCVVAIEIIEHIENHFHFIKNIDHLLNLDGVAIVSTPNINTTLSRLKFFMKGDFDFFNRKEIGKTGHINPLFLEIFLYYVKNNTSLLLGNVTGNIKTWENMLMYPSLKIKLIVLISRLLSIFIKNRNDFQILILTFIKK